MKHSLKAQMIAAFAGLVAVMIAVFLIVNIGFLERYYVSNKEHEFEDMYQALEEVDQKGIPQEGSEELENMNRLAEKKNISVLLVKSDWQGYYTTEYDAAFLLNWLRGCLFGKIDGEVLSQSDNYQILKSRNPMSKTEYIGMWGVFDSGDMFIMQSPLESIRDSVTLFNEFIAVVGGCLILLSVLVAWFFSRRITEPLTELATLSTKMADLDFEARYTRGGSNEIAVLGNNFNQMSEKLESTISDLKKANYELRRDIEQKERIASMQSEFLANVSHELKTPIALIQGYAEGLKEGISDDQESREFYCAVIMDEAGKMNRMVKNLLTLNQLEFGEDDMEFDRFDVVDLIRGVIGSSEILIGQKEAKVLFRQEEPVYVWADEFKVEQVVRNYFNNALNHLEGDHVIEIKIQTTESLARISIFNTGKPIPEEDIPHIWEKFYKVDKARTREYGGNGIGLSIVKAIMESFQKDYGVQNYDNGVEFWFELDMK